MVLYILHAVCIIILSDFFITVHKHPNSLCLQVVMPKKLLFLIIWPIPQICRNSQFMQSDSCDFMHTLFTNNSEHACHNKYCMCCKCAHGVIQEAVDWHIIRYQDKTPSHKGPILHCTAPPTDKGWRRVPGPVLLGDVTGGELENTVAHSHGLLCMPLVPPSTGQFCLNTTPAGRNGYSSKVMHTALDIPPPYLRQETFYNKQY